MHFPSLTIGRKDDPKGRTFTVHYVASIQAPGFCPPAGSRARGSALRGLAPQLALNFLTA